MLYTSAQIQIHFNQRLKNQLFKFDANISPTRSLNPVMSIEKSRYACEVVPDETRPCGNTFLQQNATQRGC